MPPILFSFESYLLRPPLEPNPDGRRDSVTTLLAGPASIVQNGPARSQITIRDAGGKRGRDWPYKATNRHSGFIDAEASAAIWNNAAYRPHPRGKNDGLVLRRPRETEPDLVSQSL